MTTKWLISNGTLPLLRSTTVYRIRSPCRMSNNLARGLQPTTWTSHAATSGLALRGTIDETGFLRR